jgi:hypothetical protein
VAEIMKVVVPIGIGALDGLSDVAFEQVDVITARTAEPISRRPSTWLHLATSAITGILSMTVLKGDAQLMSAMVCGRHLGNVAGALVRERLVPAVAAAAAVKGVVFKIAPGTEVKVKAEGSETKSAEGASASPASSASSALVGERVY